MDKKRTILIALDGSPASSAALELGLEIAAARGCGVTLLHGSDDIAERLFAEDPMHPTPLEHLLEVDAVLRAGAEAAREAGVAVDARTIGAEGHAELVPAILGTADAVDAEMIVVGSRGRGSVKSLVLGSVSSSLLTASTRPLLVVHANGLGRA